METWQTLTKGVCLPWQRLSREGGVNVFHPATFANNAGRSSYNFLQCAWYDSSDTKTNKYARNCYLFGTPKERPKRCYLKCYQPWATSVRARKYECTSRIMLRLLCRTTPCVVTQDTNLHHPLTITRQCDKSHLKQNKKNVVNFALWRDPKRIKPCTYVLVRIHYDI